MEWYIEFGGVYTIDGKKIFGRKIYIKVDEIDKINKIQNRFNNIDVYSTNYIYNDNDQNNSDIIGPLYLDFDGNIEDEESYKKVRIDTILGISYLNNILNVPKEFIKIYFSGNKGFHLIVPNIVFGINASKDLNSKYKMIAKSVDDHTINHSVDTRIYDKKRLIRMPHTINGKTGLYKVPITEDNLRNFTYEEMIAYAKNDKNIDYPKPRIIPKAKEKFLKITTIETKSKKKKKVNSNFINPNYKIPPCIKNMFNNGAEEGERNNTLIILASSILQKGTVIEECIELMKEWNITKNDNPLTDTEVETTVQSAYRGLLSGRRYGCASITDMGLCVGSKCRLYKK